jgi:hypothetical protein
MSNYPNSIYSPRTRTNRSGVVYDASKQTVLFAEDLNLGDAETVAVETELGTLPKGSDASVKARLDRIDSSKLANVVDDTTPQLGGNLDLNEKGILENPAPTSSHTANGPIVNLTAGAALVMGDVCYMGSDGKMEKANADVVATAFSWVMALATISENVAGLFALPGCFIRDDSWSWATLGQPVYLSAATPGAITQTPPAGADDVIQIIGIAITATVIYFNPCLVQVEHS